MRRALHLIAALIAMVVLAASPFGLRAQQTGGGGITPTGVRASAVNSTGTLSTTCLTFPNGQTWCQGTNSLAASNSIFAGASSSLGWSSRSLMSSSADGLVQLTNNAFTGFTRLILGTNDATANGASWLVNSGSLEAKTGDGTAFTAIKAAGVTSTGVIAVQSELTLATRLLYNSPPTVTSAGTSPTVPSSNGINTFRINVGTGGTATTIVLAMPSAATGWNCSATNITAAAANRADGAMVQQSSTTTAVTVQYQAVSTGAAKAFTASDIVQFICFPF